MRTPSLYSQDDPLSAALKPPTTETEAERSVRLVREADAKRISEQIDEDLRLERERLKRRKGDVKVCHDILQSSRTHIFTITSLV
jgi:guanine nucleotide-binding protein alpha-1 subunit